MYAQTASNPPSPVFELAEYNGFDAMPNWIDPFVGTPEERIAKLKTPGVRDRMRQDVGAWAGTGGTADVTANWAKMRVVEVRQPRNFQYEGLTIAELAEATGKHPMDAMLDLALNAQHEPVNLSDISERQSISISYLEQLFGKLRRHQLVKSTRGPGGGYRLAKPMESVSVADIIFAVDEPLDATQCGGKENCDNDQRCMTHELWASLNRQMIDFLDSVSLRDLVEQQKDRATQTPPVTVNLDGPGRRPREADVKESSTIN